MERLTYDFSIGGNHCWQVKGADNLECREVCQRQGDKGCKDCPIAIAFDRLAAYEDTGLSPEEIIELKPRMEGGKVCADCYPILVEIAAHMREVGRPQDASREYIRQQWRLIREVNDSAERRV